MFFMLDTAEPTVHVNGEVTIHLSPLEIVFLRFGTKIVAEPHAVYANGFADGDGKAIDFSIDNPFIQNRRGGGLWSKTLRRNGISVRVSVIMVNRRRYEWTISAGESVVCYSLLNKKPIVFVVGNTEQWCEAISNFMKGGEENE